MQDKLIASLWFVFTGVTCAVLFFVALLIWLVTFPFDKKKKILQLFTCAWASLYTYVVPPWRIKIVGREKIRKNATYVVVSNHQSLLDILVIFRLYFHFKWVAKKEAFKIPFIGWNMYLNDYVSLQRGDRESILQMLRKAGKHLQAGRSVFFFPEGTRSASGMVEDFKPGAFELALQHQVPILPIAICGTSDALPKHSLNYHGVKDIFIEVMDEIPYAEFKDSTPAEVASMVQAKIAARVEELKELRQAA